MVDDKQDNNLIPLITTEITSPATTSKSESLSINVNEIPVMKFPLPQSMKGDILMNGMTLPSCEYKYAMSLTDTTKFSMIYP